MSPGASVCIIVHGHLFWLCTLYSSCRAKSGVLMFSGRWQTVRVVSETLTMSVQSVDEMGRLSTVRSSCIPSETAQRPFTRHVYTRVHLLALRAFFHQLPFDLFHFRRRYVACFDAGRGHIVAVKDEPSQNARPQHVSHPGFGDTLLYELNQWRVEY